MFSKNVVNAFAKTKKRQGKKQTAKKPNGKASPACPQSQKTNHATKICWNGPIAANRLKRHGTGNLNESTDESPKPDLSKQNAPTSILINP